MKGGRFMAGPGAGALAAFRERTLGLVRDISETQGFSVARYNPRSDTGILVLLRPHRAQRVPGNAPAYAGQFVYHFAPQGGTLSFFGSEDGAEAAPHRAPFAFFYMTEADWLHSVEPMYALLGDLARTEMRRSAER